MTLANHKRMQKFLFGDGERPIMKCEQRGVRTSQGCYDAVLENIAANVKEKTDKSDVVELNFHFQKAYDNVNHAFLEELLDVYGFLAQRPDADH